MRRFLKNATADDPISRRVRYIHRNDTRPFANVAKIASVRNAPQLLRRALPLSLSPLTKCIYICARIPTSFAERTTLPPSYRKRYIYIYIYIYIYVYIYVEREREREKKKKREEKRKRFHLNSV